MSKYDIHMPLRRQGAAQGQRKQQRDVHAVAGLGDSHRGASASSGVASRAGRRPVTRRFAAILANPMDMVSVR